MKNLIAILTTLVVALFAGNALAFDPPASPAPVSWISDSSHVLSDAAHARLDAKLKQINQSSANEVAALIVPSLEGNDINDVGDLTAKAWGVGKKDLDNGVLVVLAMKEHKSRISTGKGAEGDLPDLKAKDILNDARPYLRKGDVEGALGFIFDSSSSVIANHKADVLAKKTTPNTTPDTTSVPTTTTSNASCSMSAGAVSSSIISVSVGFLVLLAIFYLVDRSRKRAAEAARLLAVSKAKESLAKFAKLTAASAQAQSKRAATSSIPTPVVQVPVVHLPETKHEVKRIVPHGEPIVHKKPIEYVAPVVSAASAATLAAEAATRKRHAEDARRRREQDEEDNRRRQRDDDARRSRESSSSSSSSFDWSGSSSSDSGGFGGGDSGGGGASSDW